jgi:hypothetical protein
MSKFKSRKFIAMVTGTVLTTVFTFAGLLFISSNPESSSAVVNLITVSLATINGCIGIYALGQSAVDWKVTSVSSTQQINMNKMEKRDYTMKYE